MFGGGALATLADADFAETGTGAENPGCPETITT